MIIVDTNVLLNTISQRSTHYAASHAWLRDALTGPATIGFCWVALLGFVRIGTNRRVFPSAITPATALDLVDRWCARPNAVIPEPTARHAAILRGLLESVGTAGNLTTDAHIAALALEYGARVATFDRDFERFGVKIVIPGA